MPDFYLILVIILFLLAISDLIVGVSNDAVNFLNSAIGSKSAPGYVIMIIASLGIVIGATFSNGMMEVARSGIFNPGSFNFGDIMIIALAVMITDVLLLDVFNTFGLPTSTTVSIVFDLLGASVGVAFIKIRNATGITADLGNYINSENVLFIISGILLSVVISFIVGVVVQYIARIIFSFNYRRSARYFGSVWGGLAITAIIYFILIKGAKGSTLITGEQLSWITSHTGLIILICFTAISIILQVLTWLFSINVFKIIVLFGTFALAMAFAGNDLVNFIGVPLAGYEAYRIFEAQSALGANSLAMGALAEAVKTPPVFLIISGLIMTITLWLSKKARTVTRTELSLGNQETVNERFSSSYFSRSVVRLGVNLGKLVNKAIPAKVHKLINKRFDDRRFRKQIKKDRTLSFDLVRASVNLAVSSSLIAFATSHKLPLSTTYVTFMVSMSTALADKAWGRESAVYRISGVFAVIGGWFFTALVAFVGAFIVASLLFIGGKVAITAMLLVTLYVILRTHRLHKKREETFKKSELEITSAIKLTGKSIFDSCNARVVKSLKSVSSLYLDIMEGFIDEKRKKVAKACKDVSSLDKEIKLLKKNAHRTVLKLHDEEALETGEFYVQTLDYLRETAHSLSYIADPVFTHIDNNHASLKATEGDALRKFLESFEAYMAKAIKIIETKNYDDINKLIDSMNKLIDELAVIRKIHIKTIKAQEISTRVSMLYMDILAETKSLILYTINIVKTSRDFSKAAYRI